MRSKQWMCLSCSKSFSRKGDLTRHAQLHTGIKPYTCETCGKGFVQNSGLKTHRNIHTKAKPYVCGLGTCKKAFGDPSSCARHKKETHSLQGAYKCPVSGCGSSIKRRSTFGTHMKDKHQIDTRALDLNALISSTSRSNSQETDFHFLPPYVPDTPYCPPSKTGMEPAIIHCTTAAPIPPMNNYQTPVTQYDGNSDVTDYMYEYRCPSAGRSTSSLMLTPSVSTSPPSYTGDYLGSVFDNGYSDMLSQPPAYTSVSPPSLVPSLDGSTDSLGSRMRLLSSSPASSLSSALDDPLDFAFLGNNVPQQYLLFKTT